MHSVGHSVAKKVDAETSPAPLTMQRVAVNVASVPPGLHYSPGVVQRAPAAGSGQALPDGLRAGIESLSGMDMSGVRVHYGSSLPAQLNALAYAQGSDIHLARGQEKHLPHEAWHVVQQSSGRVKPTMRMGGVNINDNAGLEREADQMGVRALHAGRAATDANYRPLAMQGEPISQRVLIDGKDIKPDATGENEQILSDALDAIIEAQEGTLADPDSWVSRAAAINAELQLNGTTPAVLKEIEDFYKEAGELNFLVNPVLREAWQRCLNATSNKTSYSAVGGKFKDKLPDVLHEISVDFPGLAAKTKQVPTIKVNKEHMVNKGGAHKGSQTAHENLMFAAAPPIGATETLSEFHKQLHALKPGTGQINYNALDDDIRTIIEDAQMDYSADGMGDLV
ncbi:DUF4157 domain-containing protein [Dyella subtropica]|uniref:eCIS core domain-containing protein n=1 Tax=Dyella subtropica TaxID=2992127 RepID=UPI00224E83BC|nr:DUF4157 domain-containing protein [Dyella subtropica]